MQPFHGKSLRERLSHPRYRLHQIKETLEHHQYNPLLMFRILIVALRPNLLKKIWKDLLEFPLKIKFKPENVSFSKQNYTCRCEKKSLISGKPIWENIFSLLVRIYLLQIVLRVVCISEYVSSSCRV